MNKTYVEEDNLLSVILTVAFFAALSISYRLTYYILAQIRFGRDIILPIHIRLITNKYVSKRKRNLIKISSKKIVKELTTTAKVADKDLKSGDNSYAQY